MSKNPRNGADTDWSQSNFRKKKTKTFMLTLTVRTQLEIDLKTYSYENHHVLDKTLKLQPFLLAA